MLARVKIEKKLLLGGCIPAKYFMLRIAPQARLFRSQDRIPKAEDENDDEND